MDFNEQADREEIYSRPVRAGKRTYFFDVKSTKGEDLYLTITESKKRFRDDGTFFFDKHKIFLYKEDFDKFVEGLNDAIAFIIERNNSGEAKADHRIIEEINASQERPSTDEEKPDSWSDVNFEDLGQGDPLP
jgi:hypothetical protein